MLFKSAWYALHRYLGGTKNNTEINNTKRNDASALPPISTLQISTQDYQCWISQQATVDLNKLANTHQQGDRPYFHFLMPLDESATEQATNTIHALIKQSYPHWQLTLLTQHSDTSSFQADSHPFTTLFKDARITLTNAFKPSTEAKCFFSVLPVHGQLAEHALYEFANAINADPNCDFLYCDEDQISTTGLRHSPHFKPSFAPDLLDSQSYIGQLTVFHSTLLTHIDPNEPCGLHAHKIALLAHRAKRVQHLPLMLYHQYDTPMKHIDEQQCWQQGLLDRRSDPNHDVTLGLVKHSYRVRHKLHTTPTVSILIPFKDKAELLIDCVSSLFKNTDYPKLDVIGISNNSEQEATQTAIKQLQAEHPTFRVIEKNIPFNFSALCNFGVAQAQGEFIVLLNNDIKITSSQWLESLLEHAQRPSIGAVGATLYFPDGRIQHAGIVAGMHGLAGHSHLYFDGDDCGYQDSLMLNRNVSAVTGALLMVSKQKYQEVGGLDEQHLAVAYNDVDLCFKLLDAGYQNMVTPYCHAIHHESATRGYEDTPEKVARLTKEQHFFVDKWNVFLGQGDRYFSPHFDLQRHDFKIKLNDEKI